MIRFEREGVSVAYCLMSIVFAPQREGEDEGRYQLFNIIMSLY